MNSLKSSPLSSSVSNPNCSTTTAVNLQSSPIRPPQSPILFSDVEESPQKIIIVKPLHSANSLKRKLEKDCAAENEIKLVRRVRDRLASTTLTQALPSSVLSKTALDSLTADEMLTKMIANKDLFFGNYDRIFDPIQRNCSGNCCAGNCCSSTNSINHPRRRLSDQNAAPVAQSQQQKGSLLIMHSEDEARDAVWPEVGNLKAFGLYYNQSRMCELFEYYCGRMTDRVVRQETASTTQAPVYSKSHLTASHQRGARAQSSLRADSGAWFTARKRTKSSSSEASSTDDSFSSSYSQPTTAEMKISNFLRRKITFKRSDVLQNNFYKNKLHTKTIMLDEKTYELTTKLRSSDSVIPVAVDTNKGGPGPGPGFNDHLSNTNSLISLLSDDLNATTSNVYCTSLDRQNEHIIKNNILKGVSDALYMNGIGFTDVDFKRYARDLYRVTKYVIVQFKIRDCTPERCFAIAKKYVLEIIAGKDLHVLLQEVSVLASAANDRKSKDTKVAGTVTLNAVCGSSNREIALKDIEINIEDYQVQRPVQPSCFFSFAITTTSSTTSSTTTTSTATNNTTTTTAVNSSSSNLGAINNNLNCQVKNVNNVLKGFRERVKRKINFDKNINLSLPTDVSSSTTATAEPVAKKTRSDSFNRLFSTLSK